jgi:hypothetical protein
MKHIRFKGDIDCVISHLASSQPEYIRKACYSVFLHLSPRSSVRLELTTANSTPQAMSRMWKAHDQTLASCWEFSREIQSRVNELEIRASWDMQVYQNSAQLDNIAASTKDLVQNTWELYEWARDEGKTSRPAHPWDTEPASRSEYARALGLKGGRPMSPMRGVVQLHKQLMDVFDEVMKF